MNSNPHADNTDGDRTETTDHPQRDPDAAASHDDGETSRALSRRRFVQATGATAGALALGGTAVAGAQPLEETCESFGEIDVGDGDFLLINNDWGESVEDSGFEMCSWLAEDGSYGYEWTTRPDGGEPNYPQVLLGTKPWGDDSDVGSFPRFAFVSPRFPRARKRPSRPSRRPVGSQARAYSVPTRTFGRSERRLRGLSQRRSPRVPSGSRRRGDRRG